MSSDYPETLLDYNPEPLIQSSEYFPYPTRGSPVTFYDKHIDSSLVLKHVKPMPILGSPLSMRLEEKVDEALRNPAFDHELLSDVADYERNTGADTDIVSGAVSVAQAYERGFSSAVRSVASTLLNPSAPDRHWSSLLRWSSHQDPRCPPSDTEGSYSAEYSLCFPRGDTTGHLDDDAQQLLQKLAGKAESAIAIWEIFAVTAEDLIRDLVSEDAPPYSFFHWDTCVDRGAPPRLPSRNMQTPDAVVSSLLMDVQPDRRPLVIRLGAANKRGSGKGKAKNRTQDGRITKPSKDKGKAKEQSRIQVKPPNRRRGPDPNHFIQHAWTRAVVNDATFIIFHCGNLERIGIRHRATQTLYLSELIDVTNWEDDPQGAYGKLQVGLYMAIVQDLEGRLSLLDDDEADDKLKCARRKTVETSKAAGKRKALEESEEPEPEPSRRSKKRKLEHSSQEECEDSVSVPNFEPTSVQAELISRNFAFMRLQYGAYHSSFPASFLRTSPELSASVVHSRKSRTPRQKASYKPHEYFTIILGPLSSNPDSDGGATHTATLVLRLDDNTSPYTVSHKNVLVKMGFSLEEKERLQHEYLVYERLARKGVRGVPYVFGMFQDLDVSGGVALVLMDDGETLSVREDTRLMEGEREGTPGKVKVSPTERAAFIATLNAIHGAGVLHGNIQSSNLRITADGDVQFTNFGDATLDIDVVDVDVDAYLRERHQLRALFMTETAEIHFHQTRSLVPKSSGGRYYEVREEEENEWSQETVESLVVNN